MGDINKEKTLEKLEKEQFLVISDAKNLLLHNKTPGYEKRFRAWARNTQGEHLDNLIDAALSALAYKTITSDLDINSTVMRVAYYKGQARMLLDLKQLIREHSSETKVVQTEDNDDVIGAI